MNKAIISLLIISLLIGLEACKKAEDTGSSEGIKVGNVAPEFTLPDINGIDRSPADYKGNLVLLEFWASWCSYCKAENPNLVALHNAYKHKGLKVLAVSLDTDRNKWLTGIATENLDFDHVSDFKGFDSPIVKMFDVGSIPFMFLIDENGVILEISNRTIEVAAKVEQHYQ